MSAATDVKPQLVPCYPVSDGRLGDALAGRLLPDMGASKPDRTAADWLYQDGRAAGVRWGAALADEANRLHVDAAAWLNGFVVGALAGWYGRDTESASR